MTRHTIDVSDFESFSRRIDLASSGGADGRRKLEFEIVWHKGETLQRYIVTTETGETYHYFPEDFDLAINAYNNY